MSYKKQQMSYKQQQMSYFDNKQKNLLPEDIERTFMAFLGDCVANRDFYGYFTEKDYEEHLKDYNNYINFYDSKGRPLINIILEAYLISLQSGIENNVKLYIRWILSKKKININAQDFKGDTPLHLVAIYRNRRNYYSTYFDDLQLKLIKKGADISIKNNDGLTSHDIYEKGLSKNDIIILRDKCASYRSSESNINRSPGLLEFSDLLKIIEL